MFVNNFSIKIGIKKKKIYFKSRILRRIFKFHLPRQSFLFFSFLFFFFSKKSKCGKYLKTVRSKLTNPPKLRSNLKSRTSPCPPPSREGNCELNQNQTSLASLVNRQWARENCQREIFSPVAEERERESTLAPLIPNIFSRHTLQLGLNLLRFTSTSPPAEIPICSGTRWRLAMEPASG